MAEFAPNLDDGELWLPSEIIADVGLQHYHYSSTAAARVRSQRHAAEVERLCNQLAALRRIDAVHLLPAFDHPRSALPLHLEGFEHFGPLVRFEPLERELRAATLLQSRRAAHPGAYGERFGVGLRRETIQHLPAKPVQLQVLSRPFWRRVMPKGGYIRFLRQINLARFLRGNIDNFKAGTARFGGILLGGRVVGLACSFPECMMVKSVVRIFNPCQFFNVGSPRYSWRGAAEAEGSKKHSIVEAGNSLPTFHGVGTSPGMELRSLRSRALLQYAITTNKAARRNKEA